MLVRIPLPILSIESELKQLAGTKWDDSKYPYQTVGQLVFPKQDSDIDELRTFWEDNMWIYAWRGPKIMQPLGGSNRARRVGKLALPNLTTTTMITDQTVTYQSTTRVGSYDGSSTRVLLSTCKR